MNESRIASFIRLADRPVPKYNDYSLQHVDDKFERSNRLPGMTYPIDENKTFKRSPTSPEHIYILTVSLRSFKLQ